jgi:hypothetical protein
MMRRGWTRRGVGAAGLSLAAAPALSSPAAADPLSGKALYADVIRYAAFGDHRTGTAGDLLATGLLEYELKVAGLDVQRQWFDLSVFDLKSATVRTGGRSLQAFPLWMPKAGAAVGPLSRTAAAGAVALLSLPYGTGAALETSQAWRKPVQAAIEAGAAAVVVITEHPLGEFAAYNCAADMPPWPVPVVGVAGRDAPALLAALGQTVEVAIAGTARPGRSNNLIATRKGAGKPLIVSTPKSGWFTCAGERGSGLAIWLALARRFARSDRHLIFMAASGHEFDGHGGRLFAEHLAPKPAEARGWLHIGANVAAYDFALVDGKVTRLDHPQAGRRLAVSEALLPAAKAAFAGQPGYGQPVDVDKDGAPGELAEYQRRGYAPLVGMVGLHPLHHTRRDIPDVTGPELLEPVARGLVAIIERL